MRKIVIIDYEIGNVRSFQNALIKLGVQPILSNKQEDIMNADGLILPGVGAFKTGMDNLKKFDLPEKINDYLKTGKPFLGVCLGMQMLFDKSEEFGVTDGLGLISGKVEMLGIERSLKNRLPHIGWKNIYPSTLVNWDENSPLGHVGSDDKVYFIHTYVGMPEKEEDVLAYASYGEVQFCAAVNKNNIFGTQFHPEKSGKVGLTILNKIINF